jgi:mRNA interferase MazF
VKRGDLVTVAMRGDYGKPRPALVIQSDLFSAHPSITVLPITSELRAAPLCRLTLTPTAHNGLKKESQIMVDKALTVAREKIGKTFGKLDRSQLLEVERCLAVFLGIA